MLMRTPTVHQAPTISIAAVVRSHRYLRHLYPTKESDSRKLTDKDGSLCVGETVQHGLCHQRACLVTGTASSRHKGRRHQTGAR